VNRVTPGKEGAMKRRDLERHWKKVIKGRPAEAKVIDPASVATRAESNEGRRECRVYSSLLALRSVPMRS
jgi:hypothetical protein